MPTRERLRAQRARAQMEQDRTVSDWMVAWLNAVAAGGARPWTLQNYEAYVRRMTEAVGDLPIRKVTVEALEAWRDRQAETCKPSTVNKVMAGCHTFFRFVEQEGGIDEAPTLYIDRLREQAPSGAVLAAQVRRSIAKNVETKGRIPHDVVRDHAILSLLEDTGLRAGECAGLLLENVDLRARQAFVHEAIAKGGKARTVVFGFETAKLLDRYIRERSKHRYQWSDQLFLSKFGPASYAVVRRCVQEAAARAGVIGAKPHQYRHSFAHEMKRAGASDEVLMSLAGWSSPAMLRRYGASERTARAIEAYQQMGSVVDRGQVAARSEGKAKPATGGRNGLRVAQ